jgi:hypothetical protein
MQLIRGLAALIVVAAVSPAFADGELVMRGAYYKEKATRVMQPMLDGKFDVGDEGTADAHFLADAITSASVAAGAEDAFFTETRLEGGGGYAHILDTLTLGASARYSSEPDYKSTFGTLRASKEMFDRNFTAGLSLSVGYDDMDDSSRPSMEIRTGHLDTYLGSVTLSQILSPDLVAGVTYDVAYLQGEQANLYRSVIAGGTQLREHHPNKRTRHAGAGSLKWFVPRTLTTVIASYRFYHDTWSVDAHTPDLRVIQDVGDAAWFTAHYRYHTQTKAYFHEEQYPVGMAPLFISDDEKLTAFDSHTVGAQLEVAGEALGLTGRSAGLRGQLVIEYIAQDNDFGNAVTAHAALTVPFEY